MLKYIMGWWIGEENISDNYFLSYHKCSDCGDYKEVSKKYINKINNDLVTICYDCGKKRYIESLMAISAIEGFDDV